MLATVAAGTALFGPFAGAATHDQGRLDGRLQRLMLSDFRNTLAVSASADSLALPDLAGFPGGVFSLATAAGRMDADAGRLRPLASRTVSGAHYATSFRGATSRVDVGARETPLGFRSYLQFRDRRRRTFSWDLSLPGRERLLLLSDGVVGVLAPAAETFSQARASTRVLRPGDDTAGARVLGGVSATGLPSGWRLVATVSAPSALDIRGREVPSSLTKPDGDRLTLRVGRGGSGPVVARMNWSPTGDLGNGWWSHGAERPLRSTTWKIHQGRRTPLGGCAYRERGTLPPGVIEEARDVAVSVRGCRTLVETGRLADRTVASASTAAATVHRNKAFYKDIQEDVAQIDVNSVKDVVDWRWNRRCTRALQMYDKTDAYAVTGWELVKRRPLKSRRCQEATMQTYAKFKGGQFFPFCTGFRVTTIYANNIVQGFPNGKGAYHVYRVTGGPPCHTLLHWDSRRGNKRIY